MTEIKDESTAYKTRYVLYRSGVPSISVEKADGVVVFKWMIYGPQYASESKELIQGILDMTVIADQLENKRGNEESDEEAPRQVRRKVRRAALL